MLNGNELAAVMGLSKQEMLNPTHKKTHIGGPLGSGGCGPDYGAELFDGDAAEIEVLANNPNGRMAETNAGKDQVAL